MNNTIAYAVKLETEDRFDYCTDPIIAVFETEQDAIDYINHTLEKSYRYFAYVSKIKKEVE